MDKFFIWFGRNRKPIGFSIGGLAVLSGVVTMATGDVLNGVCSAFIGLVVLFDTVTSP
jgi:hypothetical protein